MYAISRRKIITIALNSLARKKELAQGEAGNQRCIIIKEFYPTWSNEVHKNIFVNKVNNNYHSQTLLSLLAFFLEWYQTTCLSVLKMFNIRNINAEILYYKNDGIFSY